MSRKYIMLIGILFYLSLIGCEGAEDRFKESRRHYQIGLEHFKEVNLAEAIMEFQYVIHLDPTFAEAYYYLGLAYQKSGSLDEAKDNFKHYLMLNPDHIDTHLQLARIYHTKAADEETIEQANYLLDHLPNDDPARVEMHFILGDVYLKVKRDYEAASYHFRQVMEHDPQLPAVYFAFAQIYSAQGEKEQAVGMLKQAMELDPDHKEARNYLMDMYKEMGKTNELRAIYLDMLKKTPAANKKLISDLYLELAQMSWDEKDVTTAMEYAQKGLDADNTSSQFRVILAKGYLGNKNYTKALEQLEILRNQSYDTEELSIYTARIYRQQGRIMEALDIYEKLVFIRPDNFEAQYNLTELCLQTQQWERAGRAGNDMLLQFYNFYPAYLFMARANVFLQETDDAVDNLESYLLPDAERENKTVRHFYQIAYPNLLPPKEALTYDLKRRNIEAHYLLGVARLCEKQYDAALKEFMLVSKLKSDLGDAYLHIAILHHLKADYTQALHYCQLAAQQVGINLKLVHFVMGNIYTSLGEIALAGDHFNQAQGLIIGFDFIRMDMTKLVSIKNPPSLARLSLGTVYILNGWKQLAKPEFEKAHLDNPNNPLAKYLDNELYQLMNKYYYKSAQLAKTIDLIYQKPL